MMLEQPIPDAQRLHDAALPAFFRPRDAEVAGIPYGHLRRMESAGLVEREGVGTLPPYERRFHGAP